MKNKLHRWEEKHKNLCFVNMQKNLKVYNLDTGKEDFIYSGVRLYQSDDINIIIKETQKEILKKLIEKAKYLNEDSYLVDYIKGLLEDIR